MRRGGSLQVDNHRLLAIWAADCAEHVLHHVEQARPEDDRPRRAIELERAWARGELMWQVAREAGFEANAAAREAALRLEGGSRRRWSGRGRGHVAAHELGAAAYAISAVGSRDRGRPRGGRPLGVPVAARPTPPPDPRSRARR